MIRLPRISNFTDIDALALEPGVAVRFVTTPAELADADLVVVPGTRATVADLGWLRGQGLDSALKRRAADRKPILAICGGYQMLGTVIHDDVESAAGRGRRQRRRRRRLRRARPAAGGHPLRGRQDPRPPGRVRGGDPGLRLRDPSRRGRRARRRAVVHRRSRGRQRPRTAAGRRSTAAATARSAAPCGTGSWRTTSSAGPISPRPPGSRAGTSPPRPIPPSPPPGRRSSTRSPTPSKSTSIRPPCCGSSSTGPTPGLPTPPAGTCEVAIVRVEP